jgi:hypothetical protein
MTRLQWPAAGLKSRKNPENEREFAVTDEWFTAVHAEGNQVLKDCMDIASATALYLRDCRGALPTLPTTPTSTSTRHRSYSTTAARPTFRASIS